MWTTDELEYFTGDDGDRYVKMEIGSNMLPKITVDTYQKFTPDRHEESEMEYLDNECGYDMGEYGNHFDTTYDMSSVLPTLAEWCVDAMNGMAYHDAPYEVGKVLSTYSPRYYNFETDSFTAEYTLNLSMLIRWATEVRRDNGSTEPLWQEVENFLRYRFSTRDGFISHVTPALNDHRRIPTLVWGLFYWWMEEEFEEETWFYSMLEKDYNLWSEVVTIQLTEEGWEANKRKVVQNGDDHLLPDDDDIREEYETMREEFEAIQAQTPLPGL